MATQVATLSTPALEADLNYSVLSTPDKRTVLLGEWQFGLAHPETATTLQDLPTFEIPPDTPADSLVRQDVQRANGLLSIWPRKVFDAFKAGRNTVIFLHRELHRLTDKGYTGEALDEVMAKRVESALILIDGASTDAYTGKTRADDLKAYARSTFPARKESEFQETLFDAAIIGRLGELTEVEKAQLREGMLPQRLTDSRTVEAVYRTPPAMHGIGDDMLELLQGAYMAAAWPCITQATTLVYGMVEAARLSLSSACMTCAQVGRMRNEQPFERVAHGDWLAEVRFLTLGGVTQAEMLRQEKLARAQAGIFPEYDLPT